MPMADEVELDRFLPTHLSYVGLFFRADSVNIMSDTWDWDEFESTLEEARSEGMYPIAIGGAFTSPALSWLGMLDMRFNGASAYRSFLEGERGIADQNFDEVFATLQMWKDKDYFHPQSWSWSWVQAMQAMLDGEAACTLLSASSAVRVPADAGITFLRLPGGLEEDTSGEIAHVYGYSILGSSAGIESALAWAQSVSQVYVGNGGIVPFAATTRNGDFPDQRAFFERDALVLPPLEAVFDPQNSYDIGLSFSRFLRDKSYSASDLRDQIERFLGR